MRNGKEPHRPPARPLADSDDITYLYLAFDTVLPAPIVHARIDRATLPPKPDLSAYTSPLTWHEPRKRLLLLLSCIATFLTAYAAGAYAAPSKAMAQDLGASSLAVLVGITTFCLGFAFAPMLLAPLSELWGRYPVFVCAGIVYVVAEAGCAWVTNLAGLLVARLFVGIGGSVFSSVVGGVIADLWDKEGRNLPMALFSGSVLVGTGAGPLIASVIMQRMRESHGKAAWQWVFWHQAIAGVALMVALFVLFRESRASVLLARRARALNRWYDQLEQAGVSGLEWPDNSQRVVEALPVSDAETQVGDPSDEEKSPRVITPSASRKGSAAPGRIRWVVRGSDERVSLARMVSLSVRRPFHMLVTEPIVFWFSLWVAFAWAVLYLTFASIPFVFGRVHGFDTEQSGYVFTAMIAGACVATVVGVWQEQLLRHPQWRARAADEEPYDQSRFWALVRRRFPAEAPESRLYFSCVTSVCLPLGLFVFGFTARADVSWAWPAIGVGLATWGIYSVYLATFNYFADSYHSYASSALAAQSFCRNVLGGCFPLVSARLFQSLGEAGAGGLLGGIALVLTIVPWVLVFCGEGIRRRSRLAMIQAAT